jgi:hypothetical protein
MTRLRDCSQDVKNRSYQEIKNIRRNQIFENLTQRQSFQFEYVKTEAALLHD